MPSKLRSKSKEELQKLIEQSNTITEVLSAFGMENKGSNHRTLKKICQEWGICLKGLKERSHKARTRNSGLSMRTPLEDVLNNKKPMKTATLKSRLLEAGLIKYECSECMQGEIWEGKTLVLHLDHIDGNNKNNSLENLRLLCPNCHSQTDTYCGKNK